MKILDGEQAARLDRLSIRKHRVPAARLMARASQACIEALQERLPKKKCRIVIVAGPGNNGGDGLAMAQPLVKLGHSVEIFCFGKPASYSPEAQAYYQQACQWIRPLSVLGKSLRSADAIVDAIFGIGLKRPVLGELARAIRAMNRSKAFRLAVDIPSGISIDSGEVLGEAFRADQTVTFETPKRGQVLPPAWDYVGNLKIAPIGLSRSELKALRSDAEWVDSSLVASFLKPRSLGANKGKGGKVWILAGSSKMPGAGYLCATSALRSGAGLATWALPEGAYSRIDLRYPEVMLFPVKSFSDSIPDLNRADAVAAGPGWGRAPEIHAFLKIWLPGRRPPTVFDADALNLLAEDRGLLRSLRRSDVLTPHWKEMSRLSGKSIKEIEANPWKVACDFARRYRCILVLKGYRSLVATPEGKLYVNSSGGPNLATGGSGDVLAGLIAGLIAQGLKAERAAIAAVYIHGRAGDLLAQTKGDRGSLASDLFELWPNVLKELLIEGRA